MTAVVPRWRLAVNPMQVDQDVLVQTADALGVEVYLDPAVKLGTGRFLAVDDDAAGCTDPTVSPRR